MSPSTISIASKLLVAPAPQYGALMLVNGVINIVTKPTDVTQGVLVSAGGGSPGTAQGLAQYGGKIGQAGTYRVFGDYSNRGNLTASDGRSEAADGWRMSHGGFRSDWTLSPRDSVTVQGDLLRTNEGQTVNVVYDQQLPLQRTFNDVVTVDAANVLGRWSHTLANGSDTSLQVYYDRYDRLDVGATEVLNTVDVDFQNHIKLGVRHDIVWGAGYRVTADQQGPGYSRTYIPLSRTNNLLSAFAQDEIALGHSIWFTLGSKFEHNAYTGFEYEPSAGVVAAVPQANPLAVCCPGHCTNKPERGEPSGGPDYLRDSGGWFRSSAGRRKSQPIRLGTDV